LAAADVSVAAADRIAISTVRVSSLLHVSILPSWSWLCFRGFRRDRDRDPAVAHADGVRGQPYAGIIQTLAGAQVEALFEDGRGDLGDAGAVADDAARDHERAREGVVVPDRE